MEPEFEKWSNQSNWDDYDYFPNDTQDGHNTTDYPPPMNRTDPLTPEFKVACFILYSIIFILGLVGNVLFCYIVISSRSMKTFTYHLLVNLSVSDLLITCLCGPVHVLHSLVMSYWPFGSFLCYTFTYFQGISVFVSSFTLVLISFERYISILHPLKSLIPQGGSTWIILGIWVVSLLASLPNPLQTKHFQHGGNWICTTEMDLTFHISSVVFLILQYILPVALTSYFYAMVAKTIWSRRDICQLMDGTSHKLTKELQMLRSKRKMIKMLIVVVVCYTVCWLPFNVYWVLGLVLPSLMHDPTFPYIFTIVHILAVSHTCYNPVIYCWMNRRVRYGFMDIMGKLRIIRLCFPHVDWESTRLARHARQTQFTVVRRNRNPRGSGRGSTFDDLPSKASDPGVTMILRNGYRDRSTGSLLTLSRTDSRSERHSDLFRAGSLNIPAAGGKASPNFTTTKATVYESHAPLNGSISTGSGTSGTGVSVNTMSSTSRGSPKLTHNIEMTDLYREEPLLQKVHNQRLMKQINHQKISTISNNDSSNMEITSPGEVSDALTQTSYPTRSSKISPENESFASVPGKSSKKAFKNGKKESPTTNKIGVRLRAKAKTPFSIFKRKSTSTADVEIIATTTLSKENDDNDQEVETFLQGSTAATIEIGDDNSTLFVQNKQLSRSISEEIAESCLMTKTDFLNKANTKQDERYN